MARRKQNTAPATKGTSHAVATMLPPMHVLADSQRAKRDVSAATQRTLFGFKPALLRVAETYGEKLALLAFQSERLMRAYNDLRGPWSNRPDPDQINHFATASQRLAYDLCFEYVALKIAYDALGKVIAQLVLPYKIKDKNFTKAANSLAKKRAAKKVPQQLIDPVISQRTAYDELDDFRTEFVHRSRRTLIFKLRNGHLAFNLKGHKPAPIKTTVRRHIRTHFELAFQVEAYAMSQERIPPHVPTCMFVLTPAVADLYRPDKIRTFGIERFLIF